MLESLKGTDNLLNAIWYLWRRNNWMIDPHFFLDTIYDNEKIENPIFFLGTQGCGLTLISRMIRRHPKVVSITGNYRYWVGADEMQQVMGPILPSQLTGLRYKAPSHPVMFPPRSWSYACDELLPLYRGTENDATPKIKSRFQQIIKYCLWRFGKYSHKVFTDKSQVFTVKVSFINELLAESDPIFVLVFRNPYASCIRAAEGKAIDMKHYKEQNVLSREQRIRVCAEHWYNSYRCALKDGENLKNMLVYRFEDFLHDPQKPLEEICEKANLKFTSSMLPNPNDRIPLGAKFRDRWYPLKENINLKYLSQLTPEDTQIIYEICGEFGRKFGY